MEPEALFPAGVEATLASASVQPAQPERPRTPHRRVSFKDEVPTESADERSREKEAHAIQAKAESTVEQPRNTSAELWQAIHKGDHSTIEKFVQRGACSAGLRDASGHSVLWHLIAWGHFALAVFMIDRFQFGSEGAAEAGDVHPTRGDTLLHMLCRARPFGAEAAEVFKRVARISNGTGFFCHRNANGETFLDVAAGTLNFWAVKFTARNFPSQLKEFICTQSATNAPLRNLARHLAKPPVPAAPTGAHHPQHLDLTQMLKADPATGLVPYADVAFDVGPSSTQRPPPIQAHRAIVGTRSPILLQEFQRKPLEPVSQLGSSKVCWIRIDGRISREVFMCALDFVYSGEVRCSFARDASKMIELLNLCIMYQLPRPLGNFVSGSLCGLLPSARPKETWEVFSIASACARNAAHPAVDIGQLLESAGYWFFRNAHEACAELTSGDVSKLVERTLDVLEASIFKGSSQAGVSKR